ncbi:MAG: hypothetical protein IPM42_10000 [Saprospiraceae bacterium]|nr:hypothetical protein [Saprospiraceae bacterium]
MRSHSNIKVILKTFPFIFLLIISTTTVFSQSNISIKTSPFVTGMMERFIDNGKRNEQVRSWRIQIITTDDRREMEQARTKFSSMYPGISMDWKHEAPYYQVRVGAYENKIKMMPFLLELRKIFPSSTPVLDNIQKRTLVNN